ncbi:hypothetical protein QTP88_016595 [Uroleucon formosanum]
MHKSLEQLSQSGVSWYGVCGCLVTRLVGWVIYAVPEVIRDYDIRVFSISMLCWMTTFAVCMAIILTQYAAPAYPSHHAYAQVQHVYTPTPYNSKYSVNDPHTYDMHSQFESSDGNGNVKGSYSLVKPEINSQGHKTPYSKPAPCYKSAYSVPAYSAQAYGTTPNKAY